MKKRALQLTALLLSLCLLLAGCAYPADFLQRLNGYGLTVPFDKMAYTRPDMDALEKAKAHCLQVAETADSADVVMEAVYEFYDLYDSFYTNSTLAAIHYSTDLSNAFWQNEREFCTSQEPAVEAEVEELFCALADTPLRQELEQDDFFGIGFFDDYDTDPVMDQTLVNLLEQEAQLEGRYYDLSDLYAEKDYQLDDVLFREMAECFLDLVKVRQKMASHLGYADYPSLAYDMYYYRDYTPAQAADYAQRIGQLLYAPYVRLQDSEIWEQIDTYCSEEETYRYLKQATTAMGGTLREAFRHMDTYDLYNIWYSQNKLGASTEYYIWNYYAPYILMNPNLNQDDKLSFAHEFGHYAADYACDGTFCGIDIAEVHSQALEHLTLCYGKDTELLTQYKLADDLSVYVEQSAYALFEHRVYQLDPHNLSVQTVLDLYAQTGKEFGFDKADWDPREFVTVLHFYTDPLYTISYVLSNDLAMQFYQRERETSGAGLALYEQMLSSQETYILTFAETYGLENPFSDARLQKVSAQFQP